MYLFLVAAEEQGDLPAQLTAAVARSLIPPARQRKSKQWQANCVDGHAHDGNGYPDEPRRIDTRSIGAQLAGVNTQVRLAADELA